MVLFDPLNVRYLTDSTNMQVWIMHNAARYAFVATEGPVILFEFHNARHLSAHSVAIDEIRPATGPYFFHGGSRLPEIYRKWSAEIADLIDSHGGGNRRLALDHGPPAGIHALEGHNLEVGRCPADHRNRPATSNPPKRSRRCAGRWRPAWTRWMTRGRR